MVLLPAVTGDFGVMPGHVKTVAQLRPGVVTVHNQLDKDISRYFVSSGFAFVHGNSSTDICAVEACKVEDLDPEAVRAGLQVRANAIVPLLTVSSSRVDHLLSKLSTSQSVGRSTLQSWQTSRQRATTTK